MQGVAVVVSDSAGDAQHYAYECHTPQRLAEIVEATVRALPQGWRLDAVTVA